MYTPNIHILCKYSYNEGFILLTGFDSCSICLLYTVQVHFQFLRNMSCYSGVFYRLLKLLRMLSLVTKNSHKPFSGIAAAGLFFYCFCLCLLFPSFSLIGIVEWFKFVATTVSTLLFSPLLLIFEFFHQEGIFNFSRCHMLIIEQTM